MQAGLINLQHYVESNRDYEITWDSPFFQMHYPIDWNWDRKSIDTGHLTDENTRSRKAASATLAKLLVKHLSILTLQYFTNNAGFEKRGEHYTPILGYDVGSMLSAIKQKRERQRAFRRMFEPFCMGAGCVDLDSTPVEEKSRVSKAVGKRIAESVEAVLPPISWNVDINGIKFEIALIFQIHPFILDFEKRNAYYPITIGLHFRPKGIKHPMDYESLLDAMDAPWLNPKTWSKSDRKKFWAELLKSLKDLVCTLAPSPPPEVAEAIVSIAAKIKIPKANDQIAINQAISRVLNQFTKTGQVLQWDCETKPIGTIARRLDWSKLSDEDFERLLYNLVSMTKGYETPQWLTHTNAPDKGRDIGVNRSVIDPLLGTRHTRVVIQCKHKTNVGIAEVSQLQSQMCLLEPPRIDELVVATSGRFSTDAVEWVEKHNQSNTALRIAMWPCSHLELLLAERPHLISEFKLG